MDNPGKSKVPVKTKDAKMNVKRIKELLLSLIHQLNSYLIHHVFIGNITPVRHTKNQL